MQESFRSFLAHVLKPGAALKFNQYKRESCRFPLHPQIYAISVRLNCNTDTDFIAPGPENAVWNVVRSEFDHILLEHASSLGAKVFESTKVTSLQFDENNKPISAPYTCRSSPDTENTTNGVITFEYLVDATGRAGLTSTKYLKNRKFRDSLKNIAVWGYWTGTGSYAEGTPRAGAPFFEALTGTDSVLKPRSTES